MFENRKTQLFDVPVQEKGTNAFVQEGLKVGAETKSGNGSLKYETTRNDFVDEFGSVGQFLKPRSYSDISKSAQKLYAQAKSTSVKFILYLRLISRKCKMFDGTVTENVQRGAGLKHESIMRMIWLAVNDKNAFWNNIQLFISCGSWKDIFEMMRTDLEFHGYEKKVLDWNKLGDLIMAGLENPETSELVKKYLPQITAKSKCNTVRKQANTIIGKFLSNKIFGQNSYKKYRLLKAGGTAHVWQQLISKKLFTQVNFDSIHGRALSGLVSSKFLANNGLEDSYTKWIESKPVAKYTGWVHELANKIGVANNRGGSNLTPYQKMTINKQYDGLVELAKLGVNTKSGLMVVRDTSSSMQSPAKGTTMSSYDIGKALGIFFGDMLEGHFKNSWIEFNSDAKMHTYKTKTFVDKWLEDSSSYVGGTNFLSVIRLFGRIKQQGIEEKDFPTGIICVSDNEFNPGQLGQTNVQSAKNELRNAGFSKEYVDSFQIILWNIPNNYYSDSTTKFETFGETKNVFYLSGYDGSILSFLLGGSDSTKPTPQTDVELFQSAMSQEILDLVKV